MALGDFFARLTGRKAEPEPAPISRAPTNDDLLAALVRVEQLVADGAVPAVVASRVGRVVRIVRETIPRLGNLGGSVQAYNVMATATDYLPEAIGGYLRLPRQWADSRPVDRGKTSLMILIDQLDLLGATMDKVFDAVNRADAAALIAHGRFLQEKFGTGSTGGSLALGNTPSTPAPDLPPGSGPLQPPPGRGGG
jgi:phage FluMu protein gp41